VIFLFCLATLHDKPKEVAPVKITELVVQKTVEEEKTPGGKAGELDSNNEKTIELYHGWQSFKMKYLSFRFDVPGMFFFMASLTVFLVLICEAAFKVLSNTVIIILSVLTVVFVAGLIFVEIFSKYPLIKFIIFTNLNFSIPVLAGTLATFARSLVIFGTIFFFQGPYGKDALQAGYLIIPFGLALLIFSFVAGALADKLNKWAMCVVGPLVCAGGVVGLCFIKADTHFVVIAVFLVIVGIGAGVFNSPNTAGFMSSVQPLDRGSASSLSVMLGNFCQMICLTIIFKVMLGSVTTAELTVLFVYGGTGLDASTISTLVDSYHTCMWIGVGLLLGSFLCTFFYVSAPYRVRKTEEVKENCDGEIISEYKEEEEVKVKDEDEDMIRVSIIEEESPWEVIVLEKNVEVSNIEDKYSIMNDYFN